MLVGELKKALENIPDSVSIKVEDLQGLRFNFQVSTYQDNKTLDIIIPIHIQDYIIEN